MASAVMFWSSALSRRLHNVFIVLLDISQSSCSWLEGLRSRIEALDPQICSLLLDFHWALPGWDKRAARSDVTLPQLKSWCDYHLKNHCQAAETKLPCMSPTPPPPCPLLRTALHFSSLSLSLFLSLCIFLVFFFERPCWARFTLLWYHAQRSQTNHSHFPGSFPHCVSHSFCRRGIVSPT